MTVRLRKSIVSLSGENSHVSEFIPISSEHRFLYLFSFSVVAC